MALMLSLGLPKGEPLGLQWRDVDLDAATRTVRRALKKDGEGGLYTDEPKTSGWPLVIARWVDYREAAFSKQGLVWLKFLWR